MLLLRSHFGRWRGLLEQLRVLVESQTVLELMSYFSDVRLESSAKVSASERRESVRRQIPPLKRLCRLSAATRKNREIVAGRLPLPATTRFIKLVIHAASDADRCTGEHNVCTAAQRLRQLACDLLGILALDRCPQRLHALLEYRGIDFILQASLAHRSNAALQEAACCALRRIVHDDEVLDAERPQAPPLRQSPQLDLMCMRAWTGFVGIANVCCITCFRRQHGKRSVGSHSANRKRRRPSPLSPRSAPRAAKPARQSAKAGQCVCSRAGQQERIRARLSGAAGLSERHA